MMCWLSFVDPDKPYGEGFLGVVIVRVDGDMVDALEKASQLGINPGGEVRGYGFTEQAEAEFLDDWPAEFHDRLISKDELNAKGEFSIFDREQPRH